MKLALVARKFRSWNGDYYFYLKCEIRRLDGSKEEKHETNLCISDEEDKVEVMSTFDRLRASFHSCADLS